LHQLSKERGERKNLKPEKKKGKDGSERAKKIDLAPWGMALTKNKHKFTDLQIYSIWGKKRDKGITSVTTKQEKEGEKVRLKTKGAKVKTLETMHHDDQ